MTKHALVILAAAAALAAGCKSDAQKVCSHLSGLASKAGDDDKLVHRAAEQFRDTDKCVAEVEKLQSEDPEVFSEAKVCILDSDKIDDAIGCMFKAALDKKKS